MAHVAEGLLAQTLPRAEWTHEGHLAATVWLICRRPDIDLERDLPAIIRSYNESVGGLNDDSQGYHETLTQFYIADVRRFVAARPAGAAIVDTVNALLCDEAGGRDWPLRFYSRERLFSVAARRAFVPPDLVRPSS